MPFVESDEQLLHAVVDRNLDAAEAALQAGASVNGLPETDRTPIAVATDANDVGMVDFLLQQGACPNKPVTLELELANVSTRKNRLGVRALHIAALRGNVKIVRLLLKGSRADPNATDNEGCTPLMLACSNTFGSLGVVRVLLEAGADPDMAACLGLTPLHLAAQFGNVNLVHMLHCKTPGTLNRCSSNGTTPLYLACNHGHEGTVSKLLSVGAMQLEPSDDIDVCPLAAAVHKGFMGVVRVLINEGGLTAVGGGALPQAFCVAIHYRRARILQLLLKVDGEDGRSKRANSIYHGKHLLHFGVAFSFPDVVSILLEAGADEAARDTIGASNLDIIGFHLELGVPREVVAIDRMLQRGPAYRARSWAWPTDEEADASGGGGVDTAAGAGAGAVVSSYLAVKPPPVIGMRIFRPKENSSGKPFVRLIDRYCAKD